MRRFNTVTYPTRWDIVFYVSQTKFFLFRKLINKIEIGFKDFSALEKRKRNVRHYLSALQNSL